MAPPFNSEPLWWFTKDGDQSCLELYEQHYSAYRYADKRVRKLFCGPGDKVVLRTFCGAAFFVWRKFKDKCIDTRTGKPQAGINCAAFRNEGAGQSSEFIRQADAIADCLWPDRRHYTGESPVKESWLLFSRCGMEAMRCDEIGTLDSGAGDLNGRRGKWSVGRVSQ